MAEQGSALGQLQESNTALSEFYSAAAGYISSPSTPPEFSAFLDRLEYDELLRRARQDYNGTAGISTAIAVEEIHNNVAHVREYAMGRKGKAEIYLSITAEYNQSADYHKDRAILYAGMLSGQVRVPYSS